MSGDRLANALLDALDHDTLERLADRLRPYLEGCGKADADPWLSSRDAASYLGLPSVHALHKLTAARAIPFAQDGPGCRCYFRRSDLDRWREARETPARGAR